MQLNNDDLKFNFGCASCGYKEPHGHIDTNRVLDKLDKYFDSNDLESAERLLIFWKNEAINLNDKKGELTVLNELIGLYRRTKEASKSNEVINKAIQIIKDINLEDNVSTATIYLNIATNINSFGNAIESIKFYEKTYEIYKKNIPENDKLFASFYNNYASALANIGKFEDAKNVYLNAISLLKGLENSNCEIAISYINISYIYEALNENENINQCMQIAYKYLTDTSNIKNGNYYFELSKCVEPFRERGFNDIADSFQAEINNFYKSNI